ncbi:MAG: hypothetical protein EA342_19085 [Leptolyngbya sp. LCM1.Bin17]|nr:MAG: hypothetical protein EA342_19085 [Leptolyngbya sp. LCM1.Bin17]
MVIMTLRVQPAIALFSPLLLGAVGVLSLPQPAHAFGEDGVRYLDQLADCTGGTSLVLPMPFFEGLFMIESSIQDWQQGRCRVEHHVFLIHQPERKVPMMFCHHRPETLAIMTDEIAYEQTRSGRFSFDSRNDRDRRLSNAMTDECDFQPDWMKEFEEDLEHLEL